MLGESDLVMLCDAVHVKCDSTDICDEVVEKMYGKVKTCSVSIAHYLERSLLRMIISKVLA